MSERYTKVFDLSANMYAENAPVVISAGALLKDNQTGTILAQLKIKNITNKVIKAAKVSIVSFDTVGKQIDDETVHEYLDLSVGRDFEFGQKVPITLSNNSTRSFAATVSEVIFADNSIWNCGDEKWASIAEAKTLASVLGDYEAVKQFKLEYGDKCEFEATEDRDIWICSCGKINKKDEDNCFACDCSLQNLKNVDFAKLNEKKDARLTKEKAQKKQADTKRNKIIAIATVICVVVIFATVFIANYIKDYNKKLDKYNYAVELLAPQSQDYAEGIDVLFELGDFKDAKELIYNNAVDFLGSSTDKVNVAVDALFKLGDYKDSKEQLYNKAIKLVEVSYSSDNINTGIDILTRLENYKDSKEMMKKATCKMFAYHLSESEINDIGTEELVTVYGAEKISSDNIEAELEGGWLVKNINDYDYSVCDNYQFDGKGYCNLAGYEVFPYYHVAADGWSEAELYKCIFENDTLQLEPNGKSGHRKFIGNATKVHFFKMGEELLLAFGETSDVITHENDGIVFQGAFIAKDSQLGEKLLEMYGVPPIS